jgi:hypothetical protein
VRPLSRLQGRLTSKGAEETPDDNFITEGDINCDSACVSGNPVSIASNLLMLVRRKTTENPTNDSKYSPTNHLTRMYECHITGALLRAAMRSGGLLL